MREHFPGEVAKKLAYYVYRLIYPRNGETFYLGKGKGDRVFQHARGALAAQNRWRTLSVPAGAVLRPRPNAAGVEFFNFWFRATSAEMKSAVSDLDVLTRRIADARKPFTSNESLALHKRIVVPELKR